MFFLGVGSEDSKKKNDAHISGCQILAYHLPRFPTYFSHPPPMENNNSFPGIPSVGGKKYLGTMAGTTVLCTQYPAGVTN